MMTMRRGPRAARMRRRQSQGTPAPAAPKWGSTALLRGFMVRCTQGHRRMTASSAAAGSMPDLAQVADEAARDVAALVAEATRQVRTRVVTEGRVSAERLEA